MSEIKQVSAQLQTVQPLKTEAKTVSLSEAKAELRHEEKQTIGGVFRWTIKQNSPLENVFNSSKLFNSVFDVVLMSSTKNREFQIASTGESVRINSEDFSGGYMKLYEAAKRAQKAVCTIDANKKRITLNDDAIRVIA
jgi:Cu/Ag efflux protein CusF